MGVGLADGGHWQLTPAGVAACREARIEAIKLNAVGADTITPGVINLVRQIGPSVQIMVRLMGVIEDPVRYVDERLPSLRVAWEAGCRVFELGNEPNHPVEGFGRTHHSAAEYGARWAAAERRLRLHFPEARVLFPCPSPDPSFTGAREFHTFLRASAAAAASAGATWEGWAVHAYGPPQNIIAAVRQFALDYGREVYVTEFSHAAAPKAQQAVEYRQVYEASYPANVKALIGFVLEASRGWENETWVNSSIPAEVGRRAA